MNSLQKLISENSQATQYVIYGLIVVFIIMLISFFFSRNQDFKTKIFGFLWLIVGLAAFFAFFFAGWAVGKMAGIGVMGAFIGVVIFGFLFSALARFRVRNKTTRHF